MAKIAKGLGKFLLGGGLVGAVGKALTKKPKIPAPVAMPTRDDAAAAVAEEDELLRRRGAAADMITGVRGAEAVPMAGRIVRGN